MCNFLYGKELIDVQLGRGEINGYCPKIKVTLDYQFKSVRSEL